MRLTITRVVAPLLTLFAFQIAGKSTDMPTAATVEQRLAHEVSKMIAAGHLAPGLAHFEQHYQYDTARLGWNLDDYWHNPAELVYTLAIAIPFLPSDLRPKATSYLQTEFNRFPPFLYVHMGPEGARRESASLPSDLIRPWYTEYAHEAAPVAASHNWKGWSFNPLNIYACFKYAQIFPDEAKPLLENLRHKITDVPSDRSLLAAHPHILNVYIAGYFGYLGLQDMAGEQRSSIVESSLADALETRVSLLSDDPAALNGAEAGGFMWLVPELGDFLYANARQDVQRVVDYYNWAAPYWFLAKAEEVTRVHKDRSLFEGYHSHIYDYMSQFQVRAWALKWPRHQLENYLDVPAVPRGDLYYIQNLTATLQSSDRSLSTVRPPRARANERSNLNHE